MRGDSSVLMRGLWFLLAETGFEPVQTEEHLMFSYALRRIFRRLDPERWGFLATGSVRLLPVLGWLDRIVPKGGLNVTVFARKR